MEEDAPTVDNKMVLFRMDTPIQISLTGTDPIPGDVLKFSIVGNPSHGELTNPTPNTVTYTPNSGFTGDDSFAYKATTKNGQGLDSKVATVFMTNTIMDKITKDLDHLLRRAILVMNKAPTGFKIDFTSLLLAFLISEDITSIWFQVYLQRAKISIKQILDDKRLTLDQLQEIRNVPIAEAANIKLESLSRSTNNILEQAVTLMQSTIGRNKERKVLDVRHVMGAYIYRKAANGAEPHDLQRLRDWGFKPDNDGWSRAFLSMIYADYPDELIPWKAIHEEVFNSVVDLESDEVQMTRDYPTNKDQLGRRIFAQMLAARLVKIRERAKQDADQNKSDQTDEAFLLNVHGAWGSGKSSLLKMMRDELETKPPHYVVVEFNAWQHQRAGPAWWSFMNTVFEQSVQKLKKRKKGWRKLVVWEHLWRLKVGHLIFLWPAVIFAVIGIIILLIPSLTSTIKAGGIIALIVSVLSVIQAFRSSLLLGSERAADEFIKLKNDPMAELSKHFGELVDHIREPVAIFIDDLDRCREEYTVEFLEGIQTLFRGPNVSYVIAADRRWIHASYEKVYDTFKSAANEPGVPFGYLFLGKIFQISVSIPPVSPTYRDYYLDQLLLIQSSTTEADRTRARDDANQKVEGLRTEDEIFAEINKPTGDPLYDQAFREAAIRRLSAPEVESHTEHWLKRFAHLMEPNPRAIKRLLNAYGLARDTLLAFSIERRRRDLLQSLTSEADITQAKDNKFGFRERDKLALWTILTFRWPGLAEYIEENPMMISYIVEKKSLDGSPVPKDLWKLFSDENVRDVVNGSGVGTSLDARCISELTISSYR